MAAEPGQEASVVRFLQCDQYVVAQVRVFRRIFEYASDGQRHLRFVVGSDDRAFCPVDSSELFGERARNHRIAGPGQYLFRIARQYRTRQHVEQATVGHQDAADRVAPLIGRYEFVPVSADMGQPGCGFDARYFLFHGRSDDCRNGFADLRLVFVARVARQTIDPIRIRIKRVVGLFEIDLGNQYQTDGQSDT